VRDVDDPNGTSDYIQIPEKTLAQWRYLNKGPKWIRAGKHVRYRKTDVDAWLEQQAHDPSSAA
jgi:hypothetical protein